MSSNTPNVSPDNVAFVMANGFHVAAKHLDGLLGIPGIENDQIGSLGYAVSSIVLRAFATETALKALYMQETGDEPDHSHNLLVLFNKLECDTRVSVERRFERIRGEKIASRSYSGETEPLIRILANHKNDFVEWRYLQDKLGVGANTRPLVLNSVIEAAVEEYKSRLTSDRSR